MSSTSTLNFFQVSHLVDRVLSEYLYPTSEQPTRLTLSENIDDSAISFSYTNTMILPEELELIGPGTIIEIDSEQMIVNSVDEGGGLLTVIRGVNGTLAAEHQSSTLIFVSPIWTRKGVFDAVADSISELWPRLYKINIEPNVVIASNIAQVPSDAEDVLAVYKTVSDYNSIDFVFKRYITATSTNKAIIVTETSHPINIEYKARPLRPVDESDTFHDINVVESWIGVIVLGAVIGLLAQPDIERMITDFLIQRMKAESVRIGAGQSLRDGLVQLYEYKMSKLINARDRAVEDVESIQQWSVV